jgi:predicted ATPase
MLLVLDNCEHLADSVAALAEALLKASPGLVILATSREALRAEGEWIQSLPPLGLPPSSAALTATEALRFPAVQLFAERASASLGSFDLSDADAPVVAEICRRLDGIALAIEFAAGRLDAFGLRELAGLLDDRLQVLTRGRRTALPRHQTLRATLDWSYEILPEREQMTLRRLAIFSGGFSLSAARDVVTGGQMAFLEDFGDSLAALVDKSLVAAEVAGIEPQYRLLETTRAYAREKLYESGEATEFARRHAEYHRMQLEQAELERETRPTAEWLAEYANKTDDLRAALRWTFATNGDTTLGVALTIAAIPLWFRLSLVDECLAWVKQALAILDPTATDEAVRRRRMQLYAAVPGWLHMYTRTRMEGGTAAWEAALQLAEELGDIDHQMRATWALWGYRIEHADFREALRLAERFCGLASAAADTTDQFVGERMVGASLHFLGNQAAARDHIDRMLARYVPPVRHPHIVRFQFDQRVGALLTRSRVLWLQGYPDRALSEVEEALHQARILEHTLTLGSTLVQSACPIALLAGDLIAAERYTGMLRDAAAAHGLDIWRSFAEGFAGEILARQGEVEPGLSLLGAAIDSLRQANFIQYITTFLAALARCLADADRPAESLAAIDEALQFCERGGERWALAELERLRGEATLRLADDDASQRAEAAFRESLRIARAQDVPSWELRTATSLADLWRREGRMRDAAAILRPVRARFTEGSGTADLMKADALLEEVEGHLSPSLRGR